MKTLTKKNEWLYGFAAFGPNLLSIIVTTYIVNAFSITGIGENATALTFFGKTIIVVVLYSVLKTLAHVLDGVIDIPLAWVSDSLKTRWGRRRPMMLIGLIIMVLGYLGLCFPPFSLDDQMVANTIWIGAMLMIFFTSYTMCLLNYYATFSVITKDSKSRVRLSTWKAIFDTISYSIAFALVPLILGDGSIINIKQLSLYLIPLFLTIIIPLIMIKEPSTLTKDLPRDENDIVLKEPRMSMFAKIKLSVKNKNFLIWVIVFAIFFGGLQMFLSAQIILATGPMGLNGWQTAILNTAAFAPIPLTLFLYNKVMKKKGFRFAFQTAILSFVVAMGCFSLAYVKIFDSVYVRLAIGAIGGTIGSYGIGAFFSSPYIIPSQIASLEKKKTGIDNTSMYFAVQGLANAVTAAIGTSLIWVNIREIKTSSNEFFGTHLVTYIVIAVCLISFAISFKLPKTFDLELDITEATTS